jgi:hypothetical protein
MEIDEHIHHWDVRGFCGVIIGISKCLVCGKTSRLKDFPIAEQAHKEANESQEADE